MQDSSKIFNKLIIGCYLLLVTNLTFGRAGTLLKCEPITTVAGFKYVGTYCIDYECKFVVRKIFDEYCPYLLPEKYNS